MRGEGTRRWRKAGWRGALGGQSAGKGSPGEKKKKNKTKKGKQRVNGIRGSGEAQQKPGKKPGEASELRG